MKLTNTMKEYLFDNNWRGQIETHDKGTDITVFNEDNRVVLTEPVEYIEKLHEILGKLLKEVK